MFCTNCGAKVAENSAHCTSCGTRVDGVGLVANAARNVYAGMDEDFKRALFLGGGSVVCSILAILLAFPAWFLSALLVPASIVLGIMGLNAGREMTNRTGFYLGMIGLIASANMLYMFLVMYAVKSAAMSAGAAAMNEMGRMF